MKFTGLVYRAHNPRWSFDPASGDGAARYGGRFNAVGMPIRAYDVDCDGIVDLGDAASCQAHGVNPADFDCAWEDIVSRGVEPPSWRLARALVAEGHAGVIVPSFAPGAGPSDRNIVFWKWSDTPPHCVRAIDDEKRLPRDRRSWNAPGPS